MAFVARLKSPLFVLIGALLFASGCNGPRLTGGSNPKLPEAGSVANLRSGDSLVITLQGVPDPTANSLQIDEQGLVTLPYIGQITAAGTTTAGLSVASSGHPI